LEHGDREPLTIGNGHDLRPLPRFVIASTAARLLLCGVFTQVSSRAATTSRSLQPDLPTRGSITLRRAPACP